MPALPPQGAPAMRLALPPAGTIDAKPSPAFPPSTRAMTAPPFTLRRPLAWPAGAEGSPP
jgi:hypothetical protein